MRCERDERGAVLVFGVRYRSFLPAQTLHPGLPPQVPLLLQMADTSAHRCWELVLHEWRPDGEAYPGLPGDLAEAGARRDARCLLHPLPVRALVPAIQPPLGALTPFSLDLRYLPPR